MLGVAIDSSTHMYGDSMSIIKNTSKPESTFKESSAVWYNAVIESVAIGETMKVHIQGTQNPASFSHGLLLQWEA